MASPRRSDLTALLLVACAPSLGAAAAFWIVPGPVGNRLYAVCKGVLYGLPALWHLRVDRGPFGLSPPRRGGLGAGAWSGLAVGAAIAGAYVLFARHHLEPDALRGVAETSGFATRERYLLVAAWLCLVNAPLEEYAFRWFIDSRCRRLLPATPAALLSCLIFTAHHVIVLRAFFDWPFTLTAAAGVFTGGLIWTWLYRRYASIWPGTISHVLADVAILAVGWHLLFGF